MTPALFFNSDESLSITTAEDNDINQLQDPRLTLLERLLKQLYADTQMLLADPQDQLLALNLITNHRTTLTTILSITLPILSNSSLVVDTNQKLISKVARKIFEYLARLRFVLAELIGWVSSVNTSQIEQLMQEAIAGVRVAYLMVKKYDLETESSSRRLTRVVNVKKLKQIARGRFMLRLWATLKNGQGGQLEKCEHEFKGKLEAMANGLSVQSLRIAKIQQQEEHEEPTTIGISDRGGGHSKLWTFIMSKMRRQKDTTTIEQDQQTGSQTTHNTNNPLQNSLSIGSSRESMAFGQWSTGSALSIPDSQVPSFAEFNKPMTLEQLKKEKEEREAKQDLVTKVPSKPVLLEENSSDDKQDQMQIPLGPRLDTPLLLNVVKKSPSSPLLNSYPILKDETKEQQPRASVELLPGTVSFVDLLKNQIGGLSVEDGNELSNAIVASPLTSITSITAPSILTGSSLLPSPLVECKPVATGDQGEILNQAEIDPIISPMCVNQSLMIQSKDDMQLLNNPMSHLVIMASDVDKERKPPFPTPPHIQPNSPKPPNSPNRNNIDLFSPKLRASAQSMMDKDYGLPKSISTSELVTDKVITLTQVEERLKQVQISVVKDGTTITSSSMSSNCCGKCGRVLSSTSYRMDSQGIRFCRKSCKQ